MLASIWTVSSTDDLRDVRELLELYAASLDDERAFQNFARELATLPGAFVPPGGALFLARVGTRPAACVGVRPLEDECCELKHLYVRPAYRGRGLARKLVQHATDWARRKDYVSMRLDTLPSMQPARRIYYSMGFQRIEAYGPMLVAGTTSMELSLLPSAIDARYLERQSA
jgi:GNAT superfamily N-acetyltransferase